MNRPHTIKVALPRGPEHYWKAAKAFGATGFTVGDLAGCTNGVAWSTVKNWVHAMLKAGHLKKIGRRVANNLPAHVYAVASKSAKAPVVRRPDYQGVRGKIQQQLWTAMRSLPSFTLVELAVAASIDERQIRVRTAETYVRRLVGAGVVQVVVPYAKGKPGRPGARAGTWRLRKSANTGPAAPRVFNATIVFDANRSAIIGEAEVSS